MSEENTPSLAEQLKEAKAARTVANRESKKAITAQGKVKEDATAKAKKAAQTAVNKTAKAATAAEKKVVTIENKIAKEKEKAGTTATAGSNPERNALVHSVEINDALCKKAGVPAECVGKATLFVQEYCAVNSNKKSGELLKTRKEVVAEIREFGIANNTVQTQVTKYLKGDHPKGFRGVFGE